MESNKYTDIYCGFIEREDKQIDVSKYDMPVETSKKPKKEEKKDTIVYTDIYNGFVDVEEKIK